MYQDFVFADHPVDEIQADHGQEDSQHNQEIGGVNPVPGIHPMLPIRGHDGIHDGRGGAERCHPKKTMMQKSTGPS